jgi:hypothetical protein
VAVRERPFRRSAQYWGNIGLSLAIPVSALLGEDGNEAVVTNAAVVSLCLLGFGAFSLFDRYGVQDVGQVLCGSWLAVSSFWLNYSDGELRHAHFLLGVIPAVLATYNHWRDGLSRLSHSRKQTLGTFLGRICAREPIRRSQH